MPVLPPFALIHVPKSLNRTTTISKVSVQQDTGLNHVNGLEMYMSSGNCPRPLDLRVHNDLYQHDMRDGSLTGMFSVSRWVLISITLELHVVQMLYLQRTLRCGHYKRGVIKSGKEKISCPQIQTQTLNSPFIRRGRFCHYIAPDAFYIRSGTSSFASSSGVSLVGQNLTCCSGTSVFSRD